MPTPIYPIPSYGEMAQNAFESVAPNLWDSLAGAWIPALGVTGATNMLDALNRGYQGTFENFVTGDWQNDIYGPALDLESTNALKIPAQFLSDNFGSHGYDPLTIAVLFKPQEAATYAILIDTTSRHMTMMYSAGGGNGFFGIGTSQATVAFNFPIDEWSVGTVVRKMVGDNPYLFCYANGVETGSTYSAGTTFSEEIEIGGNPSGGANLKDRRVGAVYIWKRDLTVEEIGDLSDDPFLPFRLRANRVFKVPAAGGAFTLTADAGSYAITGAAATLIAGRKITAAAGSYAITGAAADLTVDRIIIADSRSYLITGAAATLVIAGKAPSEIVNLSGRSTNINLSGRSTNVSLSAR